MFDFDFTAAPIPARQWQAAKMHPTQFNSNKNRPGRSSRGAAMRASVYEYIRKQAEARIVKTTTIEG